MLICKYMFFVILLKNFVLFVVQRYEKYSKKSKLGIDFGQIVE